MRTEIIYEDDDVLVVYKPAGLATQTASVGCQDVISELKNYIRQTEFRAGKNVQSVPYLGVIHRLDQPVEGLLVFAKNPKAASGLSAQLRKQEEETGFCKHYYAVLYGRPVEASGELVDYLCKKDGRAEIVECRSERQEALDHDAAGRTGKDRGTEEAEKTRKKHPGKLIRPDARKASLRYCILQTVGASDTALADIRLETGRFHQIRAQMAHSGMPLLGDLKYGNEESIEAGRRLNVRNVALCAYRLEFVHPATGRKMDFHISPKGEVFSLFSQF